MKDFIVKYYLEIALGAVISFGTWLWHKFCDERKSNNAVKLGVQALLGDKIFYLHQKYSEKGYMTLQEQEMVDLLYEAYKATKGNHGIDKIKEQIDAIPIK